MGLRLRSTAVQRTLAVAALLVSIAGAAPAPAQEVAATPDRATTEVEALLATLKDDARRADLIAQLETLVAARHAAEEPAGERAGLLGRVVAALGRIGREFSALANDVGGWHDVTAWFANEAGAAERRSVWAYAIGTVALVIALAALAGRLTRALLDAPLRALFNRWGGGLISRALVILGRAVVGFLPTIAFATLAYGVLAVVDPLPETRVIAAALINATIVVQIVSAASNALLAPLATGARAVPFDDETAAYLHVWVRRMARIAAYGGFASQALLLLGVPAIGAGLVLRVVGLVFVGLAVILILQNRAAVADYLRGIDASAAHPLRLVAGRLADVWHLLAILSVAGAYVAWALEAEDALDTLVQGVVGTAVAVIAAKLVLLATGRALDRLLAVGVDIAERLPGVELRANRYIPVVRWGFSMVVALVALVAILEAWGLDAIGWLASAWVRDALARVVSIAGIALVALVVVEVTNGIVARFLEAKDAAGQTVVRSARLRTLLPLLRNSVLVFVVAIALFTALAEMGLDIGPLLAGAGVIGLAIGFGAQTLVKDVITGAFILFENQMAVGDVVDLGGTSGVVEAMTIRTIALRDLSGNVHVIPFGEVTGVTNMTKDYAYAVLDIGVDYREDTDRVAAVLTELDHDLRREPEVAGAVLAPIEVLGVNSLGDSAVVIRARVKTRAGHQWTINRRYLGAIKRRFDERGIEIPFPQRTIHVKHEGLPQGADPIAAAKAIDLG